MNFGKYKAFESKFPQLSRGCTGPSQGQIQQAAKLSNANNLQEFYRLIKIILHGLLGPYLANSSIVFSIEKKN